MSPGATETPAGRPELLLLLATLLLCALAGGGVLYGSPWGLGLQGESISFIEAADPAAPPAQRTPEPVRWRLDPGVHPLPGYPALLARVDPRAARPEESMRPAHALGYGMNVALFAGLAYFALAGSAAGAAACALLFAASVDLVYVHALLGAEAWLILFGYLALGAAAMYLKRGGAGQWAACGLALAAAMLLDFKAGAFFAAVLAAWAAARAAGKTRGGMLGREDEGAILLAALLPLLGWLLWNFYATGQFFGRRLSYFPVDWRALKTGLDTLSGWLAPDKVPFAARAGAFGAALLAWVCALVLLRRSGRAEAPKEEDPAGFGPELRRLLWIFLACYAALALPAHCFFPRSSYQLDQRTLAPALPAVIMLAARSVQLALGALRRRPALLWAARALCALFVLSYAARAGRFIVLSHREGRQMYGTPEWRDSEIVELARNLPKNATIYTNDYRPLYALARRRSERIPNKTDAATGEPNPDFLAQVKVMAVRVREGKGAIFYWADPKGFRPHFATEQDLASILPLRKLAGSKLGTVYAVEPPGGAAE